MNIALLSNNSKSCEIIRIAAALNDSGGIAQAVSARKPRSTSNNTLATGASSICASVHWRISEIERITV